MKRKERMISIWINALKNSDIERPFTTRQAYETLCQSKPLRGKRRRQKVPAGTNELSKRLRMSKEVKRVNTKCEIKRNVALWDFVD